MSERPRRYFAYGSNLHDVDRRAWGRRRGTGDPLGEPLGPAWLPDHELAFHYRSHVRRGGALDVRPSPGQAVPGMLYRPGPGGFAPLDLKEGVPERYERIPVTVLDASGTAISAQTYQVRPARRAGFVAPTEGYLRVVQEGLARHGLSKRMLLAAARNEPPPSESSAAFVYGTLMRGECRHELLACVGDLAGISGARAPGRLLDLGAWPGLLPPSEPQDRVQGELVPLRDPARATALRDEVEDFLGYGSRRSLYHRVLLRVEAPPGPRLAWAYRYVGPTGGARPILSGDWRRR